MHKILTLMTCLAVSAVQAGYNQIEASGARMMNTAKSGDTVKLHYTGSLADGKVFDSSDGRDPLEFKVGSGQVIAGFDKAVTGMKVDEEKTFTIPAAEAYGEHDPAMVSEIDRTNLPADIKLEKGMQLHNGAGATVTVVDFNEMKVKLDTNHSLAGQDLTFKVKLVSIN